MLIEIRAVCTSYRIDFLRNPCASERNDEEHVDNRTIGTSYNGTDGVRKAINVEK